MRLMPALLYVLLAAGAPLSAQELDPRAYTHIPVNGTFLVWGFGVSHGGVVMDPSVPIKDLSATIETPSVGIARSFGLAGKTAQAFVALPYAWGQASGIALGEAREVRRSGLADMRMRLSVLLSGAPALSLAEFVKARRRTIVEQLGRLGLPNVEERVVVANAFPEGYTGIESEGSYYNVIGNENGPELMASPRIVTLE